MTQTPARYGRLWSREETILAFELYCRTPFQKTTAKNPQVQQLARLLQRSPGSIARKLGNFGSFDPSLRERKITGLPHTSRLDREVWDAFSADWASLVIEADAIRTRLSDQAGQPPDPPPAPPEGPAEREALRRERLHQSFFRSAVLASHRTRCCVTGLDIAAALIASHIVPWSQNARLRANPCNGLCLSATLHQLYDAGYMTVSPQYRVLFSTEVLVSSNECLRDSLRPYHGGAIALPEKFVPSQECLEWHGKHVFRD